MALVIHLKRGGRIIVNGAVLKNVGNRSLSLALMNEAVVLRDEEAMTPDAAVTPARRVYYALQCAYLFPEHREVHLAQFCALLASYLDAAVSARPIAAAITEAIDAGSLYSALKAARQLIEHETGLVDFSAVQALPPAPGE